MDSRHKSNLIKLQTDEVQFKIHILERDLNNFTKFLENPLHNEADKDEIKQLVFISKHNLSSLQYKRTNLVDEMKNTELRFSKFCGFFKNLYGKLEKIYIPEGMEFDSNGLLLVSSSEAGSIYKMIDTSSLEKTAETEVVHTREEFPTSEKTAESVPLSKEIAEPVLSSEEIAEPVPLSKEIAEPVPLSKEIAEPVPLSKEIAEPVSTLEKTATVDPRKTFKDVLGSTEPYEVIEKEIKIDLKKLFKLDPKRVKSKHTQCDVSMETYSKLMETYSKFKDYLRFVMNNFFNYIVTPEYRPTRNIGPDLNKIFKDGEFDEFSKSCCYYTNDGAVDYWEKRCGLKPPLLSIKEDLSDLLRDFGYILVTNSGPNGFKNTFLCPKESENLPEGAILKNGTM